MLEKKRQEKIKATIELEKIITEIPVANGRTIEPFIKVFNYSGENVTKSSLGSLVGVFEIAEQSEDSAYIVNFLTSVAKKEYFSNPRRGAIESFEAALHKINLALAELVKHGNIAWLGKFHGTLGVLEKNNLHFSVTGRAQILLLRNGSFSEISAGLASEESTTHPIKTFVEISSGRLMQDDKIILTSPELFELLPIEDLEKNALRMDQERFAQFLRTVLMNELDMGGSLIIDLKESAPLPVPQKEVRKVTETTDNVFSQKAFVPQNKARQAENQPQDDHATPPGEEYVDSKTGHIYVQGNTIEEKQESPTLERAKLLMQDFSHALGSFFVAQGKLLRRGKKQTVLLLDALGRQSIVTTKKTSRFLRKQLRKGVTVSASKIASIRLPELPKRAEKNTPPEIIKPTPIETPAPKLIADIEEKIEIISPLAPHEEEFLEDLSETPSSADTDTEEEIPAFMKEKLAAFYQKSTPTQETVLPSRRFESTPAPSPSQGEEVSRKIIITLSSFWENSIFMTRRLLRRCVFFFRNLTSQIPRKTFVWSISTIIILALGGIFLTRFFSKNTPAPIVEVRKEAPVISAFPLDTEKNAHELQEAPIVITTVSDEAIAPVLLSNETYLVTASSIWSMTDKKQYTLPAGSGKAKFASPMDDLRLIFVYTDTNEIFSWSPISHTFTRNTLTLPENAQIEDIDTYLTYLYVLDKTTSQIYRFPRAEGGFGASSNWLRETLTVEDTAKMAINETIFLAPNNTSVQAIFRGRFVKNLESPTTPLSLTSLFTHPGLANVYALDTENKRVLVWNQDGDLIAQYFSEKLADGRSITVDEKTSEIFLTTSNTLLSFRFSL